jgi:hypothetical protein
LTSKGKVEIGRRFYEKDIAWPFRLHGTGTYSEFTGFCPHSLSLFMTVEDNEDGTVTVHGMFSTGAVGAWIEVRLEDEKSKVLWKGKRMLMVNAHSKNRVCPTPLS